MRNSENNTNKRLQGTNTVNHNSWTQTMEFEVGDSVVVVEKTMSRDSEGDEVATCRIDDGFTSSSLFNGEEG